MNNSGNTKYLPKIGEIYGNLKVISERFQAKKSDGHPIWRVKCECLCEKHTIKDFDTNRLCAGGVQSCGCSLQKYHVEINKQYNELTAKSEFRIPVKSKNKEFTRRMVKCNCSCGNEHDVEISCLVTGRVKSCGGPKHTTYKTKIGEKYGEFEVIGEEFPIERKFKSGTVNRWMVPCKCSCGHNHDVIRHELVTGSVKHCRNSFHLKPRYEVKIGDKSFCLTAISEPYRKSLYKGENEYNAYVVRCQCEPGCDNVVEVKVGDFKMGRVKSCGCWKTSKLREEMFGICKSNRPLYTVWQGMKQRCSPKNREKYEYWAGKGIKVCDDWLIYENFEKWALENGYKTGLTIHRIDNDKNYESINCVWLTWSEHNNMAVKERDTKIDKLSRELELYKKTFGVIEINKV